MNNRGIVLTTGEGNPLQAMLLAPFTVFEDGRTIIRRKANDNINFHMAVVLSEDVESLPKIKPVLYRLQRSPHMDWDSGKGLEIESHWYNTEYDRERRFGEW